MKTKLTQYTKFLLIFFVLFSSVHVFAEETQIRNIERILINGRAPVAEGANYYLTNGAGWGAPGCPGALYAFINENSTGAKAMLSMALTANAQSKPVKLYGVCSNASYFIFDYMTMEP